MNINDFKFLQIKLEPLPFEKNALLPYISEETLIYHYEKHHQAYVIKTLSLNIDSSNNLVNTIIDSKEKNNNILYNNSAQVLNHHIFWLCLQNGQTENEKNFIKKHFESIENFQNQFINHGLNLFGSGWLWLLKKNNDVYITSSANGNIPEEVLNGEANIITLCDLWEHAYYIDYRNDRKKFLEIFVNHLMKLHITI